MKLCTPDQLPGVIPGRVCRQSRLVSLLGAALMAAMISGFPLFLLSKADVSPWIWNAALAFAGLVVLGLGRWAVKSLRTDNWLLRIAPDGLWINLRSYLNRDFSQPATVLHLPYGEIASVAEHAVKRAERNSGSTATWTDRFLEIRLKESALGPLRAEIAEERRRVVEGVHLGGLVTSRSRHNHVPVTVPADDVLRIAWRGRQDFVVPSLQRVLRELAAVCQVGNSTADDVRDVDGMTTAELDQLILDRVEAGDTIGASTLLRDERGYSLKEAKDFVDELTAKL
ncbi:MAG: hypothetical protein AB7G28_07215 [Pirellulales bacterium]